MSAAQKHAKKFGNLISALFKYSPRPGRFPLEDYSSEVLSWVINNSAEFRSILLDVLNISSLRGCTYKASTQQSYSGKETESGNGGRFDIVLQSTSDVPWAIVIESKVGAPFHSGQLEEYWKRIQQQEAFEGTPVKNRYLATLTFPSKRPSDKYVAGGIVAERIVWPQIDDALSRVNSSEDGFISCIIEQFKDFLKDNGMSKLQLHSSNQVGISEWEMVKETEAQLRAILQRLRQNYAKVFGRKEIKSDSNWVGMWSATDSIYAGFGISQLDEKSILFAWLEFSMPKERCENWTCSVEHIKDFDYASKLLKSWGDIDCRNQSAKHPRVVLATPITGTSIDGDAEAVFEWLDAATAYAVSQTQ